MRLRCPLVVKEKVEFNAKTMEITLSQYVRICLKFCKIKTTDLEVYLQKVSEDNESNLNFRLNEKTMNDLEVKCKALDVSFPEYLRTCLWKWKPKANILDHLVT